MSRGTEMKAFCQWDGDTLVLNILGRPRAKRTKISKVIGRQLEIHVAEDPVRGKATAHLVAFLAEEFAVSKSAITVVFGTYNVNKQLRITAPQKLPEVIAQELKIPVVNQVDTKKPAQGGLF